MNEILLGNILSIGASACDFYGSSRKDAKQMLIVQCFTQIFFSLSYLVLGGYSAIVQNVVGIIRNILAIKNVKNKFLEVVFTLLPIPLGIWVNTIGFFGILPIIANVEYAFMVFKFKDNVRMIKLAYLINTAIFFFFNFAVKNYFMMAANIVLISSLVVFIFKDIKDEKDKKEGNNTEEVNE